MTTKEKEESGDDLGDWVITNNYCILNNQKIGSGSFGGLKVHFQHINTPNLYLFGFRTLNLIMKF
jgi:hypothetical protein